QILVRPGVNDLVQRPEVGVPEGAELRVLLPQRLALGEALLEFCDGAGTQRVGADFVEHVLLLCEVCLGRGLPLFRTRERDGGRAWRRAASPCGAAWSHVRRFILRHVPTCCSALTPCGSADMVRSEPAQSFPVPTTDRSSRKEGIHGDHRG